MCIPSASATIFHLCMLFDSGLNPCCVTSCVRWYRRYFLQQEKKKQGIHTSLRRFSDLCILLRAPQHSIFACCLILVLTLVVLLVVLDDIDDISFWEQKKRGYTYPCASSVICVSPLRAPQHSIFACCLILVLTLVVLLVVSGDIDDISFSKRTEKQGIHISLRWFSSNLGRTKIINKG